MNDLSESLERLKGIARLRVRDELWDCPCQNTGWIEIDPSGRGTVAKCETCGGPNAWCRHRKRRGACEFCKPEKADRRHGGDEF